MPRITTPHGIEIAYESVGAGPPLLLISGTGHDRTFWSNQLPTFAPHYTCITFDNRGVGQSSAPSPGYSLADMAQDARAVLDAAGAESAHVMGFSMGGHIAQELCLAHPQRVRSLGLHHTWTKPCPHLTGLPDRPRGHGRRRRYAFPRRVQPPRPPRPPLLRRPRRRDRRQKPLAHRALRTPPQGWLGQLQACIAADTSDRLAAIRVPTLVTASDLDILAHTHHAHEIHQRIPGAELVILQGNGHVALIEDPQAFSRLCLDFLQRLQAATSVQ